MATQIVILQRGWVIVGDVSRDGIEFVVEDAAVIRQWGTTNKGLGFLAEEGPQAQTVLDPCPTWRVHELTVIGRLDCNEDAWRGKVAGVREQRGGKKAARAGR